VTEMIEGWRSKGQGGRSNSPRASRIKTNINIYKLHDFSNAS
jgi:hypothetical protein